MIDLQHFVISQKKTLTQQAPQNKTCLFFHPSGNTKIAHGASKGAHGEQTHSSQGCILNRGGNNLGSSHACVKTDLPLRALKEHGVET